MIQHAGTRIRVLKFGGTSLADASRVNAVAGIVAARAREPTVVVVSAMAGVTNDLIEAGRAAAAGRSAYRDLLTDISDRHRLALAEVGNGNGHHESQDALEASLHGLDELLQGISLIRECSDRTRDRVASFGEILSATLVAVALREQGIPADVCDARRLIIADGHFGDGWVDQATTADRIRQHFAATTLPQVVTGFIASTPDGETITLGRGGSDYTAALIGAALDAEAVEIWTDVDGVMSADPRIVPGAFSLSSLSYDELLELSHFGAKVIHPPSLHPTRESGVALIIRNTLNPSFPGTTITERTHAVAGGPVSGISSIDEVALLRLEGDGMIGVPGIAARLLGALAREHISVILISQASSEHSICLAVAPSVVRQAKRLIDSEFSLERQAGLINDLVVEEGFSAIAAVGQGMLETPGVAGRLFGVLGRRGINVRAIAQGSSELNISIVVARRDQANAVRIIHDAFFRHRGRDVAVFVAGVGRVGATLIEQMTRQGAALADRHGIRLSTCGIANSRTALTDPRGIDLARWREGLAASTEPCEALVRAALESSASARVFVDCTASEAVPACYERLLDRGIAVVTANKVGIAGPLDLYQSLKRSSGTAKRLFFETTVGAGLPVLGTLSDLVSTGDVIVRIEGVLSGTLSFLFNELMIGRPFSAIVREAHTRGFTEPDPREDLMGADVVRKLVILGREMGIALEPEDVALEPILPHGRWMSSSLDEFMERLPEFDAHFDERRRQAAEDDARLCFLATIEGDKASVGLRLIGDNHPCAKIRGTDNVIALTTERYFSTPLVIRGPGAGPAVTAAGVFADVLRAGAANGRPTASKNG